MGKIAGATPWEPVRTLWRSRDVHGVELLVDTVLLLLRGLSISYWLRMALPPANSYRHVIRDDAIDAYCVLQFVVLVALTFLNAGEVLSSAVVGYVLFEIYLHQLNVIFIGKNQIIDIAPPASIERSILLQLLSIADVTVAFGLLYHVWLDVSRVQGFFNAVLVFGTLGHPVATGNLVLLVATQVFLDFVLIALVVSSFIGRIGIFEKKAIR